MGLPPHSLSEYYRGGGLVPDTSININVPTSGTISISNFYGAQNVLWTTTMTAGEVNVSYPYPIYISGYIVDPNLFGGTAIGSLSDYSVDFFGSPNTCKVIATEAAGGGNVLYSFRVEGNRNRYSFTSMSANGHTFNTSSLFGFGYDSGTNTTYWSWLVNASSYGFFITGQQYVITFL